MAISHEEGRIMYKLQITTNNHDREFKYQYEVPKKVLERYDHLDMYDKIDGWICYKGHWSHISDYVKTPKGFYHGQCRVEWHGFKNDSMSSGTLIKLNDEEETYRIGWFVSVSE